jgi:hypothetical protein
VSVRSWVIVWFKMLKLLAVVSYKVSPGVVIVTLVKMPVLVANNLNLSKNMYKKLEISRPPEHAQVHYMNGLAILMSRLLLKHHIHSLFNPKRQ